jgi:FkbM family methyltransferase
MSVKELARELARPVAVPVARGGLNAAFLSPAQKRKIWGNLSRYFTYRGVAAWRPAVWGDSFYCDASDFIQKHIYFFGQWEPALTHYIRSLKKSDGVFVDIGANIGYFSLLGSTVFKQVKAFEASPRIHKMLLANIARNQRRNIDARNVAIGADYGDVKLYPGPPGNIGMASLAPGGRDLLAQEEAVEIVTMAPLASQLDEAELANVQLIKIDVEGAEPGVVGSILESLPKMSRELELAIEITPDGAGSVRRMYDDLCNAGFEPYVIASTYDFVDYATPRRDRAPLALATSFPSVQTDILFRRTLQGETAPARKPG